MSDFGTQPAGSAGGAAMETFARQNVSILHGMTDMWAAAMAAPARLFGVSMERVEREEDRAESWDEMEDRRQQTDQHGRIEEIGDRGGLDDLDRPASEIDRPADDPSPEIREGEDGYVYEPDTAQDEVAPHDPDLADEEAERGARPDAWTDDSRDKPAA